MADEAALWGDPATLCTLEELHAARAALQTYDDVLPPSLALTRTRTLALTRCGTPRCCPPGLTRTRTRTRALTLTLTRCCAPPAALLA